ncbi:hypothetical protein METBISCDRAFT_22906 [Metschnikowia bicuspidata]|uniref:Uncharacterized protein n=1 Tax=Metschnikowia bicuspidata TaxID=27322 RepID=A0A4P9ZDA8_9ASCO|nr:hypothetical protein METBISCDRAFT_22906 [Metschnikowia bicuspidata]
MATAAGISEGTQLFVSANLGENTSPLSVGLALVVKQEDFTFIDSSSLPSFADTTLPLPLNDDSATGYDSAVLVPPMNIPLAAPYSNPTQEGISAPADASCGASSPYMVQFGRGQKTPILASIHEHERPQLSLKTSGSYVPSSHSIPHASASPGSLGRGSYFGTPSENSRSASATLLMFSATSLVLDHAKFRSSASEGVPLGLHVDSMCADSIFSEASELPGNSLTDSGANTCNLGKHAALLSSWSGGPSDSTFLEFCSTSEFATLDTHRGRSLRLRLLQLPGWPSLTHSLSNMGSSQFMASSNTRNTHTRVLSTSSIVSGASHHVRLATLKRSFSLRSGEGERSNYVTQIRKNAGTSYNEAGPGNWKLPLGIIPLDPKSLSLRTYSQGSAHFSRGSSGVMARTKKSSGVELKHGHLQPRLLAEEIDEVGETNKFGSLGRSSTLQNKTAASGSLKKTEDPISEMVDELMKDSSSIFSANAGNNKAETVSNFGPQNESGIYFNATRKSTSCERTNSLAAPSTLSGHNSVLQPDDDNVCKSERASRSSFSESLHSVHDRAVDTYYQHQGYRSDDDEMEDKPQLFLANPDTVSDSDQ